MNHSQIKKLQDLAQIVHDGADFCEAAAEQVRSPELQATFRRLARTKRDLVTELSGRLALVGANFPESGTALGTLYMAFASIKATLTSEQRVFVAELLAAEDRLLKRFNDAIDGCENPGMVRQLKAHLPRLRAGHDQMRMLNESWAA